MLLFYYESPGCGDVDGVLARTDTSTSDGLRGMSAKRVAGWLS